MLVSIPSHPIPSLPILFHPIPPLLPAHFCTALSQEHFELSTSTAQHSHSTLGAQLGAKGFPAELRTQEGLRKSNE